MVDLTYDNLSVLIKKLQTLRANITSLYFDLESGFIKNRLEGSSNQQNDFISTCKRKLAKTGQAYIDFEKTLNLLQPPTLPLTPGPTALLASDPLLDQSQQSQQAVQTYKLFSKMREQSAYAYGIMSMQATKKSMFNSNTKKSKKSSMNGYYNAPLQQLENCTLLFQRHSGLTMNVVKQSSSNPLIIEVTIGQVLRALVAVRGTMVEHVLVKSFNEELKNKETGKYNHDSLSKYEVFRKINEHSKCQLLSSNADVRHFLSWLHSYKTLFTAPCSKCGKHLLDFQLPTFRDFRSYDVCHVSCYHS